MIEANETNTPVPPLNGRQLRRRRAMATRRWRFGLLRTGPKVAAFEAALAKYCGTRYAWAVVGDRRAACGCWR